MKQLLILITLSLVGTVAYAQEFNHPVDYNNFIVNEMNQIVNKNLEYISQSVHSNNFAQTEIKRKNLVKQIQTAYNNISQTAPYQNGEALQAECVEVLTMYKQVFEIEFQEVNILRQSSEESYEAMEAYFSAQDEAEKNLSKATDKFYKAQKAFIKSHNIPMENAKTDNEMETQFKKLSEVNEYTRALYLMNFQLSKYNSIFFEAVGNKESAGLDAKRKRIEAAADRSIDKMSKMNGFKGDRDLLDKMMRLAKFYKEMSANGFVDVVKVVKSKQEDLTQDDVNRYNQAIEKYNREIQQLNNDFNQAQNDLMKKHTPKYNVTDKKVRRT